MTITKVLVPSGVLGLGFDIEALRHGIKNKPDIIIIFAWHLFKEIRNKWKARNLPKKTKYVLIIV